ncbi:MAG: type I-E CRISPR-associated protein Cas5/CasD [bacterium]
MKLLTFLLSGPLQSWGDSARWDHRSTTAMPPKSAIMGLLGCCLGYPRGDERLQTLSEQLHIAVRADRSGRPFWDFHTVQSPGGKILNAMGKPRGETIITPKQYLQDASFQVFIVGDEALLERCRQAMLHPRWVIGLGRRSCPPAIPVIPKLVEYDSLDEAVEAYWEPALKERSATMACQIEAIDGVKAEGQLLTRMDEVVRADLNQYRERVVYARVMRRGE